MKAVPPKRGRRKGPQTSRELILDSARTLFGEQGFEATSLREIARGAGVDPAMVHHYFAGKEELFAACVELPADPRQVLAVVAQTPPQERGAELLGTLLRLWDSPVQPAMMAMVRSTLSSKVQATLLGEVLRKRMVAVALTGLDAGPEELRLRGTLVASQLLGLMLSRYVLKLEPLASAGHAEIIALIGPTIQHYLTGELSTSAAG